MAYAAWSDVTAFIGTSQTLAADPTEQARLLARASELVDAALVPAFYATDGSGNPTDPTAIAAVKNAVCAQIEWWLATGDELGTLSAFQDVSLGPARLSRGNIRENPRLADRAREFLMAAGLQTSAVRML